MHACMSGNLTTGPCQAQRDGVNLTEASGLCSQLLCQLQVQLEATPAQCPGRPAILPVCCQKPSRLACTAICVLTS